MHSLLVRVRVRVGVRVRLRVRLRVRVLRIFCTYLCQKQGRYKAGIHRPQCRPGAVADWPRLADWPRSLEQPETCSGAAWGMLWRATAGRSQCHLAFDIGTNTGYARWNEARTLERGLLYLSLTLTFSTLTPNQARTLWGGLINNCRNVVRRSNIRATPSSPA